MKKNDEEETIDCTNMSNFRIWHANNCDVCSHAYNDDCPYTRRRPKKKQHIFCDKLDKIERPKNE